VILFPSRAPDSSGFLPPIGPFIPSPPFNKVEPGIRVDCFHGSLIHPSFFPTRPLITHQKAVAFFFFFGPHSQRNVINGAL